MQYKFKRLRKRLQQSYHNWARSIRRFRSRVSLIWDWLPVLWDDHDWDYIYTLKMLKFKLERQYKSMYQWRHDPGERDGYTLSRLSCVIRLLDRVITDHYENEASDITQTEYLTKYRKQAEKIMTRRNHVHSQAELIRRIQFEKTEQCWRLLWALMDRHARNFWD